MLIDGTGEALPLTEITELAEQFNLGYEDGKVRVVIHLADDNFYFKTGSKATMGNVEFDLERQAGKRLQAMVAVDDLIELAKSDKVIAITAPQLPNFYDATSEGIPIIGADELHDIDIKGQGVTIGILDGGFYGYEGLLGTELPITVVTKSFYSGGDIVGRTNHGTAVAEVVHDVAPEASLVLVNYRTDIDFLAAVDWLIAQNVDVITTSTGFTATGPLDGTDFIARKANEARDAGIIFDASSGNHGSGHHYKQFTPSIVPQYHEFKSGSNVGILNYPYITPAGRPLDIYLVWDDWGTDPDIPTSSEDYDLYLLRYNISGSQTWTIIAASTIRQNGHDYPIEGITNITTQADDVYGIIIEDSNTTSHHFLNVFAITDMPLDPMIQNPERSVVTPCVGEKVLCVGATNLSDNIESFSSQGPTIPNENTNITLNKPDLTAPDGVSTVTYGQLGFYGTSASAPHVGGAIALYLQMGMDAAEAENQIIANAVDLGVPGWDPVYGHGRLRLEVIGPMGHLEPYLIDPLSDKNVVQNEFFTFSSGVKCVGGECGDVSVTLNPTKEISYDDGSMESGRAWYYTGNMYAVRFTPTEYPVKLEKAIFYIHPDWPEPPGGNDNFDVAIFDDDGIGGVPSTLLGGPINSGTISSGWVEVDISLLDISITDGDFYIALVQVGGFPNSVGMGADKNGAWAQRSWSRYVTGGDEWEQLNSSDGNIMIRAKVGIMSTTIGATPFYTIDENPTICYDMSDGKNCNTTWRVNPTGNVGEQYEFFTLYESDNVNVEKKETEKVTITIIPEGEEFFNISLTQGWNLVSSPLNFTNITEIFKPIQSYFVSMFSYDGEYQKFIEIDPFSDNNEIDLRYGVWVKVSENVILSITGEEFENAGLPSVSGWNLVGHPYLEEKNVADIFGSNVVYAYNGSWSSYVPNRIFNSLQKLKPGYGYWVKVK